MKKSIILFFTILILLVTGGSFFFFRYASAHKPANIILITIDSLRSDHLSCYGYERKTSPNIDRLSKEGMRFTQAISPGGWTCESIPSILTGTYSFSHQIHAWQDLLNPDIKTLAWELAAKRGFHCALWSNFQPLKQLADVTNTFDDVYIIGKVKPRGTPLQDINDHKLTVKLIKWMKMHRDNPFFLYIHYFGVHVPYLPPKPYKDLFMHDKFRNKPIVPSLPISSQPSFSYGMIPRIAVENNITDPGYYISQYDGDISYVDAQIGLLMSSLKNLSLDKNTMIILSADHGEMLGEHDIYFGHDQLYEEGIRVPLIVTFPSMVPKGKVVSTQVSLIDIAPTILEAAGLEKPFYMQGESLLTFIEPSSKYDIKYVFCSASKGIRNMLRGGNWKLIQDRDSWQLYNLTNDPDELNNVAKEENRQFQLLKKKLENWKSQEKPHSRASRPIDDETKDNLRSLGYL